MKSGKELIKILCEKAGVDAITTAELQQVFAQLDVTRGWTEAASSNPRFENFIANQGTVISHLLPKAYLGSTATPHQTLTNDTWTAITGMTSTVNAMGLPIDTTNYSWIGLTNNPKFNFYVISAVCEFAAHATGDRKIAVQFYDDITATWAVNFEIAKLQSVSAAGGATIIPATTLINVIDSTKKLSRVRFQAFQSSGGDLAINAPQFWVCQLP